MTLESSSENIKTGLSRTKCRTDMVCSSGMNIGN